MGKQTKSYPKYSSGTVSLNGRTVASISKDNKNNVIGANYNMSDVEKNYYNSLQQGMNNSLNNLFTISDSERKEWESQLNALRNQGISQINSIYTPIETALKNDVVSRFGNLDNSVFLDKLNAITDKKSLAVSDLSNSLLAQQSNLYNQELSNRLNILSMLNSLNNSFNNNMMNYLNAAASNASSGNAFNQAAYNSNANNTNLFNAISGTLGTGMSAFSSSNPYLKAGGSALSFLGKL